MPPGEAAGQGRARAFSDVTEAIPGAAFGLPDKLAQSGRGANGAADPAHSA
ncbi:hypothetical protein SAMN04515678_11164 [Roseivivax sediminis]|uniref:Uncharacterized protein n=1 Tax=Roseivivax sediminis TaxID=936889 RepID=A0A1I2BLD0_9RHOB|nr:hypothetical protein SAMN04515678_11164 [Roseivivax sediminis]